MNFPIIQQHDDLIQAVDAKELYQKLGLHPANWSAWSKNNIVNNPFALEGTDYGVYKPELNTQGGRPTTNYALSIEFAKKLSMQVQTKKGEEVRDYFLECERKAKQPVTPILPDFTNPAIAARAWADEVEAKMMALEQVAELEPKAAALDVLSHVKGAVGIRAAAKALGIPERQFIARCMDENKPINARFLYRDNHGKLNAYAHRIKQGFMTQKITSYQGKNGLDFASIEVKFTPKGLAHIAELMQVAPITIEYSGLRLVN